MIFLYDDDGIEWGTGLAGVNAGNVGDSITIPESRTANIRNIDQTSNIWIPGVWVFQVDRGKMCNTAVRIMFFHLNWIILCFCSYMPARNINMFVSGMLPAFSILVLK